jgi:eukaryotic-like serine/threonine-protein kinase
VPPLGNAGDAGAAAASTVTLEEHLTSPGQAVGTIAYMSPEQVRAKELDTRTDLFSFGAVLYEMATGTLPFRGDSTALIFESILNRAPVAPVRLNPDLPPKLEEIINKCLEKDRNLRYQHAADIRTDLQRLKRGTESSKSGVMVEKPPVDWNRRIARTAGILVLIVAAFLVGYFVLRHPARLTDKNTMVLADFANTTGDPVFDGALRQGLSAQLEQSPFLNLISDQQIAQTLSLMAQPKDARLTPELAREICQRTASAAVLVGSIAQVGTEYLLTLRAINCSNAESLAGAEAQASDKNHVLEALGNVSSDIRKKLGESLATVQQFNTPLAQATTPSLEALQAYSLGSQALSAWNVPAAISLFQKATELDPNFAMAYLALGTAYKSLSGGENTLAADDIRKAYQLRAGVSERERYGIEASYHFNVTGDLQKAQQILEAYVQAYPSDSWSYNELGEIHQTLGQYDKALSEYQESARLAKILPVYGNLAVVYTRLELPDRVPAVRDEAKANLGSFPADIDYFLAFLQGDRASMQQHLTFAEGKSGLENQLLGAEADTEAYSGRLEESRAYSRQAIASAERAHEKEAAAAHEVNVALREALFGYQREARQQAASALRSSKGRNVQYSAALALALTGDVAGTQTLVHDLSRRFPEDTIVQFNYLPVLQAQIALDRKDALKAVEALQSATPFELGAGGPIMGPIPLYPVFIRGIAYLAANQSREGISEFQKILDHRGIVLNSPVGALAHLQIGRAYAMVGDTTKAKAAYQDFLTLWKDADPDIPILKQAKAEYAKLQ